MKINCYAEKKPPEESPPEIYLGARAPRPINNTTNEDARLIAEYQQSALQYYSGHPLCCEYPVLSNNVTKEELLFRMPPLQLAQSQSMPLNDNEEIKKFVKKYVDDQKKKKRI